MRTVPEANNQYPTQMTIQELRARVSIIDLAIHYGYERQPKKGHQRPVLVHSRYQDTIIIKNPSQSDQQLYQRAGDFTDAGTIIDFIRHRLSTVFAGINQTAESEFKTILSILYDFLQIELTPTRLPRQVLPKSTTTSTKLPFDSLAFDLRPLAKDNYLQQRSITQETLDRPEFKGKVVTQITYFDIEKGSAVDFDTVKEHPERAYRTFSNVAFPYYNGVTTAVTGLEIRNDQIKLQAPGSDRQTSVFISNPPLKVKEFFILESTIDALSHCQLRQLDGQSAFDSVYITTGGQLTPQQVNTIGRYVSELTKADHWLLNLAFDNDVKGYSYDLLMIQHVVAQVLPLRAVRAAQHRLAYELPQDPLYFPLLKRLQQHISTYNQSVEIHDAPLAMGLQQPISSQPQPILVYQRGKHWLLDVLKACEPLAALSQMILAITGLDHRVKLAKSSAKDYNQELTMRLER